LRSAAASKQPSWLIERFTIPNGILGRIGFRGRHFQLTVFSSFAPLMQLGALETVDPHFSALLYAGDRFETKPRLEAALAPFRARRKLSAASQA